MWCMWSFWLSQDQGEEKVKKIVRMTDHNEWCGFQLFKDQDEDYGGGGEGQEKEDPDNKPE